MATLKTTTLLLGALTLLASPPAFADDHTWTAKMSGEMYREAWDYNLSDEDLFGSSISVLYHLNRRWAAGVELLSLAIHQETVPSTALSGVSTVVRWHTSPRRGLYVEGGGGLSYAAHAVPARGTRFNYVAQLGVGVTRPLASGWMFEAELRWIHLSNNSLAGRARNPDIQAIGPRIGVALPFGRRRG